MAYPALLELIHTPQLPVVEWIDAPADLNGLVRFAEGWNLVSAHVPSHFKCSLPLMQSETMLETLFLNSSPPPSMRRNIIAQDSVYKNSCVWNKEQKLFYLVGQDNVVVIVICYRLDSPAIEIFYTHCEAHPAFCKTGTRSLSHG
jgi:hypothetical protein